MILIRDSNKRHPPLRPAEPAHQRRRDLAVARNRNADDELLRIIADRREWMRNYQVRSALATNPKTPITVAIRLLATLTERDLRAARASPATSPPPCRRRRGA